MEIAALKEQMIKALINEWDDIIDKMDISDTSGNILVNMVDGTKVVIHFKQSEEEAETYNATLYSSPTIRDLYLGNLQLCNLDMDIPGYKDELHDFLEIQHKILTYIPKDSHKDFDRLCMLKSKITGIEVEDAFVKGYQVATKLLWESLSISPEILGK